MVASFERNVTSYIGENRWMGFPVGTAAERFVST